MSDQTNQPRVFTACAATIRVNGTLETRHVATGDLRDAAIRAGRRLNPPDMVVGVRVAWPMLHTSPELSRETRRRLLQHWTPLADTSHMTDDQIREHINTIYQDVRLLDRDSDNTSVTVANDNSEWNVKSIVDCAVQAMCHLGMVGDTNAPTMQGSNEPDSDGDDDGWLAIHRTAPDGRTMEESIDLPDWLHHAIVPGAGLVDHVIMALVDSANRLR